MTVLPQGHVEPDGGGEAVPGEESAAGGHEGPGPGLVKSRCAAFLSSLCQIRELRTAIADKYAENLADNMTSCVTQ